MGTTALPLARKGKGKGAEQQPVLKPHQSESGAPKDEVNKTEGSVPAPIRSTAAASEFSADSPVSTLFLSFA